jgi:hypothetical protein
MIQEISHSRLQETIEAKARWFQSLSINERAKLLDALIDMVLEVNPRIMEQKRAQPSLAPGSVRT